MKALFISAALATALFSTISFGQPSDARETDCDLSGFTPTHGSSLNQSDSESTNQSQHQYKVSTNKNLNKTATITKGNVSPGKSSLAASNSSSTSSNTGSSTYNDSTTTFSDSSGKSAVPDKPSASGTDNYNYSTSSTDKIADNPDSNSDKSTKTSYDDLYNNSSNSSSYEDDSNLCNVSSSNNTVSWTDEEDNGCCGNGFYEENDFDF